MAVRHLVRVALYALVATDSIEGYYTFQVTLAFFWNIADEMKNRLPTNIVTPLHTIGA
jgi:hypothetical protein